MTANEAVFRTGIRERQLQTALSDEMKIFQITAGIVGLTTDGTYGNINFYKPKSSFLANGKKAEWDTNLEVTGKQKDTGVNGINQNK